MHEGVIYLNLDDVLALYADLFDLTGQAAAAALARNDFLESALASPRNHAMYEGADTIAQAAWLGQATTGIMHSSMATSASRWR